MRPQTPPLTQMRRNVSANSMTSADAPRIETVLVSHVPISTMASCTLDTFPDNILDKDMVSCMMTPTKPTESIEVDIDEEEKKRRATQ